MTTTFKRFNSPAQAEWEIVDGVLHGDISGNEYKFEMALASIGEAQFTFQLILQQGAQRIPLAESSFSVNRQEFDVYTSTVRGIDPASRSGDKLLLAADINCNGCGILFGDSQVWIPGVRR
jgi:hypothetical protein